MYIIGNKGEQMKTIASLMIMMTFVLSANAQSLQDSVNALVAKYKGEVGIYAVDLANGDTVTCNPDKRFETASVIKIWILGKLYQEAQNGKLSLNDRVVLTDSNKVPGSGILQFMNAGLNPTLHDLAWLMIDLSDNSAANMLVDQVGGLRKVDDFIQSVGLKKTKMISKIFVPHTSIDTVLGKKFGIGVTTPRETAIYLTKLYNGEIVDSASSMAMIKLMEDQTYNIDIPRFLPTYKDTITIAHKAGELNATRNDCGIVYTPRVNYVIAVFTNKNADQRWITDNSADVLIAKISRLIYDSFVK